MKSLNNFIGGVSAPSQSGQSTEIINPATATAYSRAQLSNQADVDHAMNAAADAFEEWRDSTPS